MSGQPPIERTWDAPPPPPRPPLMSKRAVIIIGAVAGLVVVLIAASSALTNGFRGTTATSPPTKGPVVEASPLAGAAASQAPTEGSGSTGTNCQRYQEMADGAKTETEARVTAENAAAAGCTGITVDDKPEGRPTAPWSERNATGGGATSVNVVDGIAWDWVDNPKCDFGVCTQMRVEATSGDCPNGFYVAVNVLDSSGTILGYSNDLLPTLRSGQSAILTFNILEDGGDQVRVSEFKCY